MTKIQVTLWFGILQKSEGVQSQRPSRAQDPCKGRSSSRAFRVFPDVVKELSPVLFDKIHKARE
jgi:hypothetical protein